MGDLVSVPMFYAIVSGVTLMLLELVLSRRRRGLPLPPGPHPRPFIGNLLDIPKQYEHFHFMAMCEKYGDIVYLDALGMPIIVLGTQEIAIELLEKRSAKYSDRRFSVMADLTGFDWFFAINPYGSKWRKARRAFSETMNANAAVQYRPVEEGAVRRYLQKLVDQPGKYRENALHMFNATIIAIAYGLDVHAKAENEKYVKIAEQTMRSFNIAFTLGEYHVEQFPFLRYLPSWFPLANFKRELPGWRADASRLRDVPWDAAMEAMSRGKATPSMASCLISDLSDTAEDVIIAKGACASAYAAGADTTFATFTMFVAAMLLFPTAQRLAQAELDAVIGPDRLPTVSDKPSLPYVSALITEVFRWQPVVPTGVIHLAMEEDEYRGYRIPRGTVVIPNPMFLSRAYSRDPAVYPDPEEFRPERYLRDDKVELGDCDPAAFVFGYGRSLPGGYFAEELLFTTIASVLHCFNISPPINERGEPAKFELKFLDTSPMLPESFECGIRLRSMAAEELLRTLCSESDLAAL